MVNLISICLGDQHIYIIRTLNMTGATQPENNHTRLPFPCHTFHPMHWMCWQEQCKLFSSHLHLNLKVISSILPFHSEYCCMWGSSEGQSTTLLWRSSALTIFSPCISFSPSFLFGWCFDHEHFATHVKGSLLNTFNWNSWNSPYGSSSSSNNAGSPKIYSKQSTTSPSMFTANVLCTTCSDCWYMRY